MTLTSPMTKRTLGGAIIVLLLTLSLTPTVASQSSLDEARAFLDEEITAATGDPVGYANRTATADGIDRLTDEAAILGCLAQDDLERETGQDLDLPPEVDPCPTLANVAGIDDPRVEADETPVAEAEELEDVTAERIDAYLDEAAATADRIVQDPTSATDEAQGLLARTLAFVTKLLEGLGTLGLAAVGLPALGAGAMTLEAADAVHDLVNQATSTARHTTDLASDLARLPTIGAAAMAERTVIEPTKTGASTLTEIPAIIVDQTDRFVTTVTDLWAEVFADHVTSPTTDRTEAPRPDAPEQLLDTALDTAMERVPDDAPAL